MRFKWISVVLFISLHLATAFGQSDPAAPFVFTPPTFTEADKNQDVRVDRDEHGRIIIDRFSARDLNADGQLTVDELPAETFSIADEDQDQKVSKKEFMRFRFGIFEQFDKDSNDSLDREEYLRWLDSQ